MVVYSIKKRGFYMQNKDAELAESKFLFEEHGITEWHEKKIMLSDTEYKAILTDLEKGNESPLVWLVRNPFPIFAEIYMNRFPDKLFGDDPAIGYKLYLLSDPELRALISHMRKDKKPKISLSDLIIKLKTPLEDFYKTVVGNKQEAVDVCDIKYIYITRYIDLKEAERIGSRNLNFFTAEGTDGYELESKLALFNPMMRGILEDGIGLNSGIRNQMELTEPVRRARKEILRELASSFKRTVGDVKNKLGVFPTNQNDDTGFIEYSNKAFKSKDLSVLYWRHWYEDLSEQERELLNNIPQKYRLMYILYKFYGFSTDKTMRVLLCEKSEALRGNLYFEGIQSKLLDGHKKF